MKEKFAAFFRKLNNSYIIAAICVILVGIILLCAMIGLVSKPFATNTTYSAKVKEKVGDEELNVSIKLVLLDDGRYQVTVRNNETKETVTRFGDYGYGKIVLEKDGPRQSVLWLNDESAAFVQKNPFKINFEQTKLLGFEVKFTNVGGIFLLVCYCALIVLAAAVSTILIIKRKEGSIVFTNKMRLIKRLATMEEMLGIRHE